jgi:hypothetical protein
MSEAYDSLIGAAFEQSKTGILNKDPFTLDAYSKTFTPYTTPPVVVQFDSDRNEWYADLPKAIVVLKDNEGIRMIAPLKDQGAAFAPVTIGATPIFSELEVNSLSDIGEYYLEENRIWFRFPVVNYTELIMKLIVSFFDLDDNDYTDEPTIMTKSGLYTIYDYVKQRLQTMPPTKQTNDNETM